MALLVNDIIHCEDRLDCMNLIAGKEGLNKRLHNISVMEVEDFPDEKLDEGLFILTTLSFCKDNPEKSEEVFKKLISKKISGMAIKLNRFISEVPKNLIDIANKNEIPLFEIKDNSAFSKIIKDVTFLTNRKMFENISRINENYEFLYNALNKGKGIKFFVNTLGELIKKKIYIYDNHLTFITYSHGANNSETIETINQLNIYRLNTKVDSRLNDSILMFPFNGYKGLIGLMFIESKEKLTLDETLIVSQFSKFISMCLIDNDLKEVFVNKERSNTLKEIVTFKNLSEKEIKSKLNIIKYNISDNFQMVLVKPTSNENTKNISFYIKELLSKSLKENECIIENIDNFCLIIANLDRKSESNQLPSNIKTVLDNATSKDSNLVSYSQILNNVTQISRSFEMLDKSISLSWRIDKKMTLINSFLFEEFIFINDMKDSKNFSYIDKSIIEPLSKLDNSDDDKYWNTLMHCIFSETTQAASEKLFVHKTTVKYRLEKIKEATGLDFYNPIHRNKLVFAFMRYTCNQVFNK